jgi:hypothetical protein
MILPVKFSLGQMLAVYWLLTHRPRVIDVRPPAADENRLLDAHGVPPLSFRSPVHTIAIVHLSTPRLFPRAVSCPLSVPLNGHP